MQCPQAEIGSCYHLESYFENPRSEVVWTDLPGSWSLGQGGCSLPVVTSKVLASLFPLLSPPGFPFGQAQVAGGVRACTIVHVGTVRTQSKDGDRNDSASVNV